MAEIKEVDLRGKLYDVGPLQFLRAQWWESAPRMVLLRYTVGKNEEPLGLRLDLDKKAILDSVPNVFVDQAIRLKVGDIWRVVVDQQRAVS
jgi:hypothetical protein